MEGSSVRLEFSSGSVQVSFGFGWSPHNAVTVVCCMSVLRACASFRLPLLLLGFLRLLSSKKSVESFESGEKTGCVPSGNTALCALQTTTRTGANFTCTTGSWGHFPTFLHISIVRVLVGSAFCSWLGDARNLHNNACRSTQHNKSCQAVRLSDLITARSREHLMNAAVALGRKMFQALHFPIPNLRALETA